MTGNFVIEKAGEKDIPVIHQLAVDIWKTYYPGIISVEQVNYMLDRMYSVPSLKNQLQDGHQFYIAYDSQQPVGYLSYSENDKGKFFLHKLYIKISAHRNGSGSKLLNYLLGLLPPENELRLTVNRKNFKAINFYFKNGFVIEEVKDFDIGNGFIMKDFVMVWKFPG